MLHRFRITSVIVLTKHYDMSCPGHATTPFLLFSVYCVVSYLILFKKSPLSIILFIFFLFFAAFVEIAGKSGKIFPAIPGNIHRDI